MTSLVNLLKKSADKTAQSLTTDIQQRAVSSGWDPSVAANTSIDFNGSGFGVSVHPRFKGQADAHEYGSETVSATSVLRKFSNNDDEIADQLAGEFLNEVGMTL